MERATSPGAVIVTGAGRGLGRGIALELAAAGYSVIINYRGNAEAAQRTLADCEAAAERYAGVDSEGQRDPAGTAPYDRPHRPVPPRFAVVQADIASAADRERLVATTIEKFGGIAGLVNNAGIAPRERNDISLATEASFEEVLRTNLQGPYFLTQLVARQWLDAEGDRSDGLTAETPDAQRAGVPGTPLANPPHRAIVFITSISAATVSLARGEYCISKAGLAMAAQLWAARLAPHGIGVYEIRPGIMETDMTSGVHEKYDGLIADGLVPQRRWGRPEDIGRAVRAFIAGDFSFSPGAVVYSDGGFHISRL